MEQKNYNVVGVMSGTSLDGIDCAFAKISLVPTKKPSQYPKITAKIVTAKTVPYTTEWRHELANAHQLNSKKLKNLNERYTEHLGKVISSFIKENKLKNIDAICSHGHTILHQPKDGITLQIGNLPRLAEIIGQKVVCDFRVQDVQMGGQGAPLVPIGDQLLYAKYDFCLNLGGFANVSRDVRGTRIAYDICPVNVVLNRYAQLLGKEFDEDGAFAKAGTVNPTLLTSLNAFPFYLKSPPKSLGIEWVHKHIFPLIDCFHLEPVDVLATFTEHVAIQLAAQFSEGASVLVTGGGAYNSYLMERLHFRESVKIHIPDTTLVEFKEALIFALLGVLKLEGLPNCMASVTGAKKDHSSGVIFSP